MSIHNELVITSARTVDTVYTPADMTKLPAFICVGAARAGTTSLWNWCSRHPEIYVSPIKETNYFSKDLLRTEGPGDAQSLLRIVEPDCRARHAAIVSTWPAYEALFKPARATCLGEFSPSYLYFAEHVAPAIKTMIPNCKIIMLLREPAARAVSSYGLFLKLGRETLTIEEALRAEPARILAGWEYGWHYAGLGYYSKAVRKYLEVFGRENVWIGLYESLSRSPSETFGDVCSFLGVCSHPDIDLPWLHQSDIWVGPLTRFSNTSTGRLTTRLLPKSLRGRLRTFDTKRARQLVENSLKQVMGELRMRYTEDVEALDRLIPELRIKEVWEY